MFDSWAHIGAKPEQLLAAAVLKAALSDAKRDPEARDWFTSPQAGPWLAAVTPPGTTPDAIAARLIEHATGRSH